MPFSLRILGSSAMLAAVLLADDSQRLLRVDHYVRVRSTAPAIGGQTAQIYVREVVLAGTALRGVPGDRVVLFVHGAGTPSEVAFDVPYQDYSWMAFLARAGFDVFGMDMTGYGRSTRPEPMNNPCNLSRDQQAQFVPAIIPGLCEPAYKDRATTLESDWNDIDGVVDYLRKLRGASRVSLVGWSLGGPRSMGYASRHADKVSRLALLSPAYGRRSGAPASQTAVSVFNTQSRADLDANWDRQLGCPDQYDPAARIAVWSEMLASDPVGASWGDGVRRAPNTGMSGWTPEIVTKMRIPALFVAAANDKQVTPDRVRELFADYGAKDKILLDLACASHNALWEKNRLLLFQASLEWLAKGSVNGSRDGVVRAGY